MPDIDSPRMVYFRDIDVALVTPWMMIGPLIPSSFRVEPGTWPWSIALMLYLAGCFRMWETFINWRDVRRGRVAFHEVRRMFG